MTNITSVGRFPLWSKTLGSVMTTVGMIGVAANIMVVLAVFHKNTSVKRTKCTILLGSLGVMDAIGCLHFVQSGILLLLDWTWFPQLYCFLSQTPYILFINASCFMILSIAVDRFFSLLCPVKYHNFNQQKYLSVMIGMAAVMGLTNLMLGAVFSTPEVVIPACGLPMALYGPAGAFWVISNMILNVLVIGCYAALYVRVRISGLTMFNDAAHMKKEKHFLNSMLIVASIYFFCWLAPIVTVLIMSTIEVSPSVYVHSAFSAGSLASVNHGCNFFVYYARSSELRGEFLKLVGKKNVVNPHTGNNQDMDAEKPANRAPDHQQLWCSDI